MKMQLKYLTDYLILHCWIRWCWDCQLTPLATAIANVTSRWIISVGTNITAQLMLTYNYFTQTVMVHI